jgi:outer membrane protein assembly factor BamB
MLVRILIIITFTLACKSKQVIDIPDTKTKSIDSIWSVLCGVSITPKITSDGNVIYNELFSHNPKGDSFIKIDGLTGKRIFEWNDYLHSPVPVTDRSIFFTNDKMIFSNGPRNYCVNTITGKTIWRTQLLNYGASGALYFDGNDSYYQSMSKKDFSVDIYKSNIESGRKDLLLSIYDSSRTYHYLQIDPMVIAKNSLNENVLLIVISYLSDFDGNEPIQKIISFNLDKNILEWEVDYAGKIYEFQSNIFKTKGNKTYLAGSTYHDGRFLVCINNDNGQIIWQQKLPDFCTSVHLYQDQVIALCNGRQPITSYNQQSGSIDWMQSFKDEKFKELNFAFDDAIVFKNYLISSQCGNLLALNLNTGHVVYYKEIAYGSACLRGGVAINESRRLFYVNDRFRILCYPLPEEISY